MVAGHSHVLIGWLTGQRVQYSLGWTLPGDAGDLIEKLPASMWQPAYDADGHRITAFTTTGQLADLELRHRRRARREDRIRRSTHPEPRTPHPPERHPGNCHTRPAESNPHDGPNPPQRPGPGPMIDRG
jgi:hypothetical protein